MSRDLDVVTITGSEYDALLLNAERWKWCLSAPGMACLIFAEATNPDTHNWPLGDGAVPAGKVKAYINDCVDDELDGVGRSTAAVERK